jgi:hypothetical protein
LHTGAFFANLATWLAKPKYGNLALTVADHASTLVKQRGDPWEIHFMYANLCKVYYRSRGESDALQKAVWACEADIELSKMLRPRDGGGEIPVAHHCYK